MRGRAEGGSALLMVTTQTPRRHRRRHDVRTDLREFARARVADLVRSEPKLTKQAGDAASMGEMVLRG